MADDPTPSRGPAAAVAPVPLPPPDAPPRRPAWGPWASIAGTILAAGVLPAMLVLAAVVIVALRFVTSGKFDPVGFALDGRLVALATILAAPATLTLVASLARVRGWRASDYLALRPASRRGSVLAISGLILALAASGALTLGLGRPVVPTLLVAATLSAPLWLVSLAVAVAAPMVEEVLLRGFLYRGIADSPRLGPGVAIGVAALAGATCHAVGQDLYGLATIYLFGLYLGAVRHYTGSTSLAIILHGLASTVTTAEAVYFAGPGG